jgi:predicted Zn-dependent peptidase
VLTFKLLVPVGAADDPVHQFGLAALTAEVLHEGTHSRTGIQLHEALMGIGGHLGIQSSSDSTILTLTTLPKHAAEAMALLVDVAARPRCDPSDCERVRDLRIHRIQQMRQVPSAVADRVFAESLYGAHPYGHTAIGTEASLGQLGSHDVTAFHERWYEPARWTLIAVGDLPEADLLDVVRLQLEGLGGRATNRVERGSRLADPPSVESRLVFVARPNAVQSEVRLGHVGVARASPDYHALLVLNMVLGGQFVSRINLNLREDKGYTYGARTSFDSRIGRGPFAFRSSVQTDGTVDAIAEVIKEIDQIRTVNPPSVEELMVARNALTRGFPRSLETATQVARAGAALALHELQPQEIARFVDRVMAIEVETLARVANAHLHPDQLMAVVVGSPDEILPSLDRLGLGEPALID